MSSREPPRLSPADATVKVRLILQEGTVDYTGHCWHERMRQRNVSTLDVEHLLRQGHIMREAEWDSYDGDWKYRIEGTDVEGEDLTAILVVREQDLSVLVITVF